MHSPGQMPGICRRAGCVVLLALAPLALLPSRRRFTSNVKLVNIFVNVTDKNGAIVGGLTRDDFAVFEDGRPQQIALFERSRNAAESDTWPSTPAEACTKT